MKLLLKMIIQANLAIQQKKIMKFAIIFNQLIKILKIRKLALIKKSSN